VGVPWELLYDQYTDQFLALAPDLTLVRYPEMPAAHAQPGPLRVEGPLQVVAVLASPTDDYYPTLRLDRELGRLEHALKLLRDKNQVQLDVIRGPGTLDQLRERLRQPVHILHILSHGDLNRDTGEGELLFEDTDGAAEPINAESLRRYLERQRGQIQLITLNACLGALPVENDPFSSVGLSLIRGGVPAVVAMQFEIAEDVAAEVTRVLYAELAAGMPIDQAVNEARLHISGRYRTRLDWAIPVLFSRAETGVLFEFPAPPPKPPPQPRPQPKTQPTSPAVIEIAPGVTMEFVEVPAGPFLMGSSDADQDARDDEKPQHELYLPTYWIGKTPVTNAQFRPFVKGDGYTNRDYWTKDGWQWRITNQRRQPRLWDNQKWNGAEYPVVGITWYEAMAYTAWLSTQTGDDCRLPTEAEWEKAARGTDGRIYPWGNTWEEGHCNHAKGTWHGIGRVFKSLASAGQTSPVRKFVNGASPYGALDMAGNVWEWTRSQHRGYPYDADDGREDVDDPAGKRFTLRGGSWDTDRTRVRCAARLRLSPSSGGSVGCRVLLSPRASP
jgi:formylglycine-generating enzyme required for sulfatase activity